MYANSLQSCLTLCNPIDCRPLGFSVHEDSPGKNTGMGCLVLLQGIFLTQGSNPCLLCLPALSDGFFTTSTTWEAYIYTYICIYIHTHTYIYILRVHACMLSCFSRVQLCAMQRTTACQAPLSMGFSMKKYWRGLACPPPQDLPNPGLNHIYVVDIYETDLLSSIPDTNTTL